MPSFCFPEVAFCYNLRAFLGVKFDLEDFLCVKYLTLSNSDSMMRILTIRMMLTMVMILVTMMMRMQMITIMMIMRVMRKLMMRMQFATMIMIVAELEKCK